MPSPTDEPKTESKDTQSGGGKTILIAEDDPFISRMYQIKLEGAGFKVVLKTNGREAYESIKAQRPDLAVLDLNMPELTGLEVLGALQSDGFDFGSMPVIVLTNSNDVGDRKKAISYGAEYLVKAELTPRQVLDTIAKKLGIDGK
ncbi:MAG TPA: response regulator [Candidatus Saccharimonadia bacterium]|jgi:CheY-like chemotaxis protein